MKSYIAPLKKLGNSEFVIVPADIKKSLQAQTGESLFVAIEKLRSNLTTKLMKIKTQGSPVQIEYEKKSVLGMIRTLTQNSVTIRKDKIEIKIPFNQIKSIKTYKKSK